MRALITLSCSLLLALIAATCAAQANTFQVLAYHDVRDRVSDDFDADQYAISTPNLIDHFTWLELNGFHVVSADEIFAARSGGPPLPERAVLLTFDDGFKSVKTHVLPLLELFDYPAVVSIVTDWIENDPNVAQAGRALTAEDFLSWDDIRELGDHPLIEIASHSAAMHRGIIGNPQGNEQPATVTLQYADDVYESADAYLTRIRADLTASAEQIAAVTGQRPRIMTWPYGAFNRAALDIAAELGMTLTMTLTDGVNSTDDLSVVARHLIEANPGVEQLGWSLLYPTPALTVRAAHVDLDYVFDPDPEQQERNLGRLLDRIQALEITHVFLQAFADPDADGGAQAVYFPNDYLPVRADLFNRAAWQLKTRANVRVFAWLPLLAFAGETIDPAWQVMQWRDGNLVVDAGAEPRLSPFEPAARELIRHVYADLARHAAIDGVLFHDDGRFNEFEDANPAALAAYRARFGDDFSFANLAENELLRSEWAKFRADTLNDFSLELAAEIKRFRPEAKTVRNIFATALLEDNAELNLAQSYSNFLAAYDYVAIMAMPRFEGYADHRRFYQRLAALAGVNGPARRQVIFELQTVDWATNTPIDSIEIRDTMRQLQSLGVRNLAYYPDDFIEAHPDLDALRQGMSIAIYPREVAP